MMDFILEAFEWANLPYTIMLLLSMVFWLSYIIGLLDMDFLDFDVDADADIDLDVDLDTDLHIQKELALDADIDAGGNGGSGFSQVLSFFNFGVLPFMLVMSLAILLMWLFAMISNHFFTGGNLWISYALMPVFFIVAMLFTKYISNPLVPLFSKLSKEERPEFVGKIGTMRIGARQGGIGQALVHIEGQGEFSLTVRPAHEERIESNEKVLILAYNADKKIYLVEPYQE
ncbi:MAG: DUF1449 family protein [Bernardetiaceae bacterium]|nr:DUF1449 family protein [Bernardetiaceae bacterium]